MSKYLPRRIFGLLAAVVATLLAATDLKSGEWSVPMAGNSYRSSPAPGDGFLRPAGVLRWNDADEVFSVYFRIDRPGTISLAVHGRVPEGASQIRARVLGKQLDTSMQGNQFREYPLGEVVVSQAGYVHVELQGLHREGPLFAEIDQLLVSSDAEGLALDYVKNNEGNMFYWGRRGPSVHLQYQLPERTELSYAYSEITVPAGQDCIGAYFMANGFREGYFGIQVNSDTERRVLFSLWSPYHTDNPKEIPEEDRVITLGKGDAVRAQDFGNEGSGGQSYLVYPWKAETTYRFLTEVKPDGKGNTRYTSWFGDKEASEWLLIASFQRPKTNTYLTGFHSFLENFNPAFGHLQRRAEYGNQWVRDTAGMWHEITRARFTGDGTARGRHRLDFAGGTDHQRFYLQHCGFFDQQIDLDQVFQREESVDQQPRIQFDRLPRP